jgi:sialic acid synthase SpsE/sugar phosphate isomerase/epimerase
MLIRKQISGYLVLETESILHALKKINDNQKRIVFVVDESGKLQGALTDGDFRRWLTSVRVFDLGKEVSEIMNISVVSKELRDQRSEIEAAFSDAIDTVPLVDDYRRVVAIAFQRERGLVIGKHTITEDSPAYIIAEIGNNHNGDPELACRLVDLAAEAGADCVKFQMRDLSSLYKKGGEEGVSSDLGAEYTLDLLRKFQLNNQQIFEVFDYCKSKGLTPLCTPWDLKSLEVLENYGMEAYKVASADFTNHQLIEALAATGKPLICSTGMSTEAEINRTVSFLKEKGVEFVLLHCNSTYPTPYKDVNLVYIRRLAEITGSLVGYSGHERGISIPVAAVALGARVIEKHFTIDKAMEGNDHKVSLLPEEFREMVCQIREVEEAFGQGGERVLSQGEMINRETLAKSLVASRPLKKGEIITRECVEVRSPGQGLQPLYIDELVGKQAKRDFQKHDYFYESDIKGREFKARDYHFNRPFGIPVRYHDYANLVKKSNLDFVEFHLSYQDLDLNLSDFFSEPASIGFAVHSPELFSGDHILDLASTDKSYLARSVEELQRVCDITRKLKEYFPEEHCPVIVVNAGGFNTSGFIDKSKRPEMYKRIADALSSIDQHGVEIIIQTMPPFPWHFGGQSYHNIFVDPWEISNFCKNYNYRICYDISHSMMACNYHQWSLSEFTRLVAPYTAHLHVVDALGVDGEGVQIGDGDVDFEMLAKELQQFVPGCQFIPEVWQGHKNQGAGFWCALEFLERFF